MELLNNNSEAYKQHAGVVVDRGKFDHVMALTINPKSHNEGIVRCVVNREGDITIKGYTDKSVLYKVKSVNGLEKFEITESLEIKDSDKILQKLINENLNFIGLEDPDLVLDPDNGLLHLYFTIPLIGKNPGVNKMVYLGHAVGKDLNSFVMTKPVLSPPKGVGGRAKELSLAPVNSSGVRLNLFESKEKVDGVNYSIIRIAIAKELGSAWEFGEIVFHPKYDGYNWCAGHASPGPLLPREFIDVGENKRVGIINGREANKKINDETKYGVFSIGLFVYDFEKGKIDWVSDKPLIIDSQAKIITFASEFIQKSDKEGILYAHVDDSFVRAYSLYADGVKNIIGKIYNI